MSVVSRWRSATQQAREDDAGTERNAERSERIGAHLLLRGSAEFPGVLDHHIAVLFPERFQRAQARAEGIHGILDLVFSHVDAVAHLAGNIRCRGLDGVFASHGISPCSVVASIFQIAGFGFAHAPGARALIARAYFAAVTDCVQRFQILVADVMPALQGVMADLRPVLFAVILAHRLHPPVTRRAAHAAATSPGGKSTIPRSRISAPGARQASPPRRRRAAAACTTALRQSRVRWRHSPAHRCETTCARRRTSFRPMPPATCGRRPPVRYAAPTAADRAAGGFSRRRYRRMPGALRATTRADTLRRRIRVRSLRYAPCSARLARGYSLVRLLNRSPDAHAVSCRDCVTARFDAVTYQRLCQRNETTESRLGRDGSIFLRANCRQVISSTMQVEGRRRRGRALHLGSAR